MILGSKVNIFIDNMGTIYKQNSVNISNDNKSNVDKIELKIPNNHDNLNINVLNIKDTSSSLDNNEKDQINSSICECKIVNKCIPYEDCYGLAGITTTLILIIIATIGYIVQYLSLIPHEYLSERNLRENKFCGFVLPNSEIVEPSHPNS
ncbi:uncharacterized protein cubi_02171 [Cryptosporidium ubiquitum]|uniref:Uncharacterized protein n=1 Tax=Cryptosporidium ubiquitum TaxID=857276 RepID=A0A1J4MIS2_9CRYT|nr:uncharacterized protein cubi_02171 [Cryptosporidium ubiquitum]OII72940.1 hypothetical protein cubi_02171 [Cryptosporidium ubiquitum]